MEDKLRALFVEFRLGRSSSPTKFKQRESLERPSEKEGHPSNMILPCMRVDFPQREKGDRTAWISCVEHYFRYYRTLEDPWWTLLSSTLKEMQFNSTISLNTPVGL
ncbi:hypothetical protein B296_00001334 [Ensete ventricosum]|uniref:Uncharacterized protein n=1 Tax=Ensete ventricosum TaxID=4639 RepID=A0A426ZAR2_ENSVE|nr:hypothetical protein B296_00001334 [Ensete ventricosum]